MGGVVGSIPEASALRPSRATYAGLFVISLATLMYEIALTRIFSVTMWYHFAFVAISVALFGLTIGALIVHLLPSKFRDEDVNKRLWTFSFLFAVSIAICFVTQLSIPFMPHATVAAAWSVVLTCFVISIPFVFSGVVVCLSLTRFPARVNRLYAADLAGAAAGCIGFVFLLNHIDGPSAVIVIGALAGLGALVYARNAHSKAGTWCAVTAVIVLAGLGLGNAALHSNGHPALRIIWAKETSDPLHEYEAWNAFSRITVDASVFGFNLPGGSEGSAVKSIVIDSTAGTALTRWDGDLRKTNNLRGSITNLAHHIRHNADVAVIGVGGGRDILSALEFRQKSVTGIEINSNILHVTMGKYGDYTGHLDRQPGVKIVNDDGRSYLTRTDKKFNVVQISLIDTWAATAAGAFALSENSLYTTQAFDTYLDRLKPGGVLTVTRWYHLEGPGRPLETYRTVALAAQTLTNRGVKNPRKHILVYREPTTSFGATAATVLTSPQPFSKADIATLNRQARKQHFERVLTPTSAVDPEFAALTRPGGPGPAESRVNADISAPNDDRPFFFQMADIHTILSGDVFDNTLITRPTLVLSMLALTVLALAFLCIMVPLLVTTKRTAHRGMAPFYTYFAGIGLAFLMVEIAQLQRLSIYLGHPTYALTVVLFSILLSSGAGSMLTERFVKADRAKTLVIPLVVLLAVVGVMGVVTPMVLHATTAETTPMRIAIAVALLAPLGLAMGMPFAIGMRAAGQRPGAPTAFLWGINGALSVCASVFAVVIALFFGISRAFWTGWVAYLVALVAMTVATRKRTAIDLATDDPSGELQAEPPTLATVD